MDFRFRLDELKDKPLVLERGLTSVYLDGVLRTEPPTGFHAKGEASFRGRLVKVNEGEVVFEGDFPMRLETSCSRCLGSVDVEIPVRFTLDLISRARVRDLLDEPVEDHGKGEIAGTFSPDEVSQVVYDGNEIDLEPVLREQILLALPMATLCEDACKGLCQICGGNLNEEECACDRHVPDPRWAALRSMKLKS